MEQLFSNPAQYHFLVADCLQRNYLFDEADREYATGLETAANAKRAIAAKAMLQSRVSPASAENALDVMQAAFDKDPSLLISADQEGTWHAGDAPACRGFSCGIECHGEPNRVAFQESPRLLL